MQLTSKVFYQVKKTRSFGKTKKVIEKNTYEDVFLNSKI